jgi:subtilisin
MKKFNWYLIGKYLVGVGAAITLIGLTLINLYEDYRPREYVQWSMLNGEPDILGTVKSNKKTAEARAFDGIVWEENIKFYAQVEPQPVDWSGVWDSMTKMFASCSGGSPQNPQPNPQPAPNPPNQNYPAQQLDWGYQKIQGMEANQINQGEGITVCITDTGIDLSHPDLVISKFISFSGPYSPRHGHGTHVAGIIAAQDNGYGTKGVAPRAKLISAQVLGADGSGSLDGIAEGIKWCVDSGAQIINMSLGGGGPTQLMYQTLLYATQKGVKVIAAAGNDGGQTNFPAAYQMNGLFAISATDQNDSITRFSSRGKIEFAAPGLDILSSIPMSGCEICSGNTGWGRMSGTSMATPYVSGAMALALSSKRSIKADPIGIQPYYGFGRINALKSVQ